MILSIIKTHSKWTISALFNGILTQKSQRFTSKKRVRELSQVKISFPLEQSNQQSLQKQPIDYVDMRQKLRQISWETLSFDKLCSLPNQTLSFLRIQLKKDKFNIQDSQFYRYSQAVLGINSQTNSVAIQRLNDYYKRWYHLLSNNLKEYDELVKPLQRKYYMSLMYFMELKQNIKLNNMLEFFVNNVDHPYKLEVVAQPSLVKALLSAKRQLMLQGIHFPTAKDEKQLKSITKRKQKQIKNQQQLMKNIDRQQSIQELVQLRQQLNEDTQQTQQNQQQKEIKSSRVDLFIAQFVKGSKIKVKIIQVLGYQYEFWVDVKHNRNKNGNEDQYVIAEKQIQNPNESMLIKQKYPKIKVKYIVRKKKRKDYQMHFCIKAVLLVDVGGHKRTMKIEWDGPSDSKKDIPSSFIITDYEHIMKGNPTIKPIFNI